MCGMRERAIISIEPQRPRALRTAPVLLLPKELFVHRCEPFTEKRTVNIVL